MTLLEAGLRGGAIALFLLVAVLLLRQGRRVETLYAGLINLGVAAYALESSPLLAQLKTWPMAPVHFLTFGNPAAFWLFTSAAFDDRYRRDWRREICWPLAAGLGCFCLYWPWDQGWWLYDFCSLVFVGLSIREALTGRSEDLVESRRRFRLVLVGVVSLYIVGIVTSSLIFKVPVAGPSASLPNAIVLASLGAWIAISRLKTKVQDLPAALPLAPEPPAEENAAEDPEAPMLLEKLHRLMEEERIYREPGLSVASLAGQIGIPEYRLRRLINGRLGHRNFTSFVNGYRLDEARAALEDPSQAAVPILTIALDTGFQSIGPFNRAFKAATGVTPTEYRRDRGA